MSEAKKRRPKSSFLIGKLAMSISLRTKQSVVFSRWVADLGKIGMSEAKKKKTEVFFFNWKVGNDLFSRSVSRQVFSALKVLTSVFGMRTGGTPSLESPTMVKCL